MKPVMTSNLLFRKGTAADLPTINRIVSSAVMSWPMAERVKRLSVPVLCYDATDLTQFDVIVCERLGHPIGVALFDLRHDQGAALLHGLYVLPIIQESGCWYRTYGCRIRRRTCSGALAAPGFAPSASRHNFSHKPS